MNFLLDRVPVRISLQILGLFNHAHLPPIQLILHLGMAQDAIVRIRVPNFVFPANLPIVDHMEQLVVARLVQILHGRVKRAIIQRLHHLSAACQSTALQLILLQVLLANQMLQLFIEVFEFGIFFLLLSVDRIFALQLMFNAI